MAGINGVVREGGFQGLDLSLSVSTLPSSSCNMGFLFGGCPTVSAFYAVVLLLVVIRSPGERAQATEDVFGKPPHFI